MNVPTTTTRPTPVGYRRVLLRIGPVRMPVRVRSIVVGLAAVVALGVLGVLAYGLLGAAGRLRRELTGLEQDVQPLLVEAQATAARAAAQRSPTDD